MSQKIARIDLFPNPLFVVSDLLGDDQRFQLQKDCYRWRDSSPGQVITNSGGWHSENTLFTRDEDSFKTLSRAVIQKVIIIAKSIDKSIEGTKGLKIKTEGWVNINKGNDFNAPHDHSGYTFSGCYYVKVPEKILSDVKSAGHIQFLDPCMGSNPNDIKIFKKMKFGYYQPKEDTLLVFPSWLKHMVHPHREQEDRISIAFNVRF
tara:strand:+ start:2159 stop:2773 length:615 start_codon:yes stop_codon:yes gene_type:complete